VNGANPFMKFELPGSMIHSLARASSSASQRFPFCSQCYAIFSQYRPVGGKVNGNLWERVFLLELNFAMANIFNYNQIIKQDSQMLNYNLVIVNVVISQKVAFW